MADYTSQFTGPEIDARLAAVPNKQDILVSGTNIKTINSQSILGQGNIVAGDPDAVKYVSQTLTDAQKAQARSNIGAASLADIADFDFVTAASLPSASASTMGHIYLIGPDASNNYERWYTQQNGSTYYWVDLGSTEIDLSGYATKDELNQLDEELRIINPHITGRIGMAADNEDITVTDLMEYTGQYGVITLMNGSDRYLWCCLENDHFRVTSSGVEIPMVYVKDDGDLHCYVSAEKIKSGLLQFVVEGIHPIKGDTERVIITANSYTITYGDAIPTFGFSADAEVEGTPSISCEATQGSDAGTYEIVITRGTVEDDNAIYVNGVLTIEKAELTITAEDKEVAVGGTMPAFTVQYSGFVLGEDASDLTTQPTCTTDAEDTDTAGLYNITPGGAVSNNYSFVYVPGYLTIGSVVLASWTHSQLFAAKNIGGYIRNDTFKWEKTNSIYGIIIDVAGYRGKTITFTDNGVGVFRFAFLRSFSGTVTTGKTVDYSTATGFTSLVQGSGTMDYVIPSDAQFMYVYTCASNNVETAPSVTISGTAIHTDKFDLEASLFTANKTISATGAISTGAANAPYTCCLTSLMRVSAAAYAHTMKSIVNHIPSQYDACEINIATYTAAEEFIRRDSYYSIPHDFTIEPEACYVYILIAYSVNGAYQQISSVPFDKDDIQLIVNG